MSREPFRKVEAIFGDFLEHAAVRSFAIARVESDGGNYALVRATAGVSDADGREVQVSLQLSLEPEAGRWIVRGIKESSR